MATGLITDTTKGSATDLEALQSPPVIAAFTPQTGFVGDTVMLAGTNLKLGSDTPAVTFAGLSGSRIPVLVTFSSQTEAATVKSRQGQTDVQPISACGVGHRGQR